MLANEEAKNSLNKIAKRVEKSLLPLIDKGLVHIKKNDLWIEVEIKSSILFSSGSSYLSDGLSDEVTNAEIIEIFERDTREQQKADMLIQKAVNNGGSDNVTVVIFSAPKTVPKAVLEI